MDTLLDISEKPIDYVIISACGKGTRLAPLTKYIPKYLINPDNFNILTHIVKYWESYAETIVLIIEEQYNTITEFYLKPLNISYKIINVNIDNQGNAYQSSESHHETELPADPEEHAGARPPHHGAR